MNNYKQLKQILDNAPEGSVFWDGEDYLNIGFGKRYTNTAYCNNPKTGKPNISESHYWVRKDPINTGKLRRLSDIQEIVDLMVLHDKLLDKAKRMCELVEDIYGQ